MPRFPVIQPNSITVSPASQALVYDPAYLASEALYDTQAFARSMGPAYRAGSSTTTAADYCTYGVTFAVTRIRLRQALDEAFLCSALYLLPDWETMLGLAPAPGDSQTQRQLRLIAHWRALRGGTPQSIQRATTALLNPPDRTTVVENLISAVVTPSAVYVFAVVVAPTGRTLRTRPSRPASKRWWTR